MQTRVACGSLLLFGLLFFVSLGLRSIGTLAGIDWLYWSGDLAVIGLQILVGLILITGPILDPQFVVLLHSLRGK